MFEGMTYEEIRAQVLNKIAEEKRIEREEKKKRMEKIQQYKNSLSVEQKIALMNTPYRELPDELKEGMVKNPQTFNFIRFSKPRIGRQKETFAARLIRYRDKYNLTQQNFCDICNEFARKHDIPAEKGNRSQKVRITMRDIARYENYNVCPKIDKLTVIAEAMGVTIDYFAGYGAVNRRSKNEIIEARYRKRRNAG